MSQWINSQLGKLNSLLPEFPEPPVGDSTVETKDVKDPNEDVEAPPFESTNLAVPDDNRKENQCNVDVPEAEVIMPSTMSLQDLSDVASGGLKNVTGIFSNYVTMAAKSATSAAEQIKHTVEDKTFIGDVDKMHKQYLDENSGLGSGNPAAIHRMTASVPPWFGAENETELKKDILALSLEKRNFLADPPKGTKYNFDPEICYPIALATLKEDPNLSRMRFALVPRLIKEDKFWYNYFYRVSLINQTLQLSSMVENHFSRTPSREEELEQLQSQKYTPPPSESVSEMEGGIETDTPAGFVTDEDGGEDPSCLIEFDRDLEAGRAGLGLQALADDLVSKKGKQGGGSEKNDPANTTPSFSPLNLDAELGTDLKDYEMASSPSDNGTPPDRGDGSVTKTKTPSVSNTVGQRKAVEEWEAEMADLLGGDK